MKTAPHTKWRRWILTIGKETSLEEIVRHIKEHATVDLDRDVEQDTVGDWIASMYNLLGVLQAVRFDSTVEPNTVRTRMLELLQRKWEENPTKFTPPP